MKLFKNSKFLLVGLARDCSDNLSASVFALRNAFAGSAETSFFVLESDSTDQTPKTLHQLSRSDPNFNYRCVGNLTADFPNRTQRIAHCRNLCLSEIANNNYFASYDYIVIADFDDVNHSLSSHAVQSCWARSDWDVCTANQNGPYYDIWALRHKLWSPNDCWETVRFLVGYGVDPSRAMQTAVFSRMIKIKQGSSWIEVDSAFGGLAIYKSTCLQNAYYSGISNTGYEICEHVSVHKFIKSNGGRIFINPNLINTEVSTHVSKVSSWNYLKSGFGVFIREYLPNFKGFILSRKE